MERRRLGGLEVSAVGLGCATMTPFYDEPDSDAAVDTVRRAREIGVDFLDSSDAYDQGRNEELIARAVKGRRNEYVIASKFGNLRAADGSPTSDGRPEYVKASCERSLKRLETDFIDLYYIHRVDPTVPIEDTMDAMSELVRQGKVRHPGICEASAATIRRAHATHPLSAVQIEYSLWTRDVEAEILPLCEELGSARHIRSLVKPQEARRQSHQQSRLRPNRVRNGLPAGGNRIRTIGTAPAKGSSGLANRRRRHERRSDLQVQVRNGNACLEWLPIAFPFAEGPRVRIRLPPPASRPWGRRQSQ